MKQAKAQSSGRARLRLTTIAAILVAGALGFSLHAGLRSSGNGGRLARRIVISNGDGEEHTQQQHVEAPKVVCPVCAKCPDPKPQAPATVQQIIVSAAASVENPRLYHVVTTCQGFSNHWQARIHYYW